MEKFGCIATPGGQFMHYVKLEFFLLFTAQIVFYIYNSVAEHPLVLHPLRLHEPWRYITYFLVHIDLFSLVVNLFVQLLVGIPLEVVHGSFRVALIYGCGVLYGSMAASLFDPYVRLAGKFFFILIID